MGVGKALGILAILLGIFLILSIFVFDLTPAHFSTKPLHLARNIADWVIEIGWSGVKFGYGLIGNQEGIDSTDRTLEIHRAWYGFRQDAHIDCCRPAECYIEKICISQCVSCETTQKNLEVYYA